MGESGINQHIRGYYKLQLTSQEFEKGLSQFHFLTMSICFKIFKCQDEITKIEVLLFSCLIMSDSF